MAEMITLQLVDVETSQRIGTHHTGKLPEPGDTIVIINKQRAVSLEIVALDSILANTSDMFSREEHLAKCRFKSA
jgi:hypothetical protein